MARIDSLVMTSGWAKAGVMIRETLDAGSKHAAVVLTPSNGVSFPYRLFTGDISYQVNTAGLTAPYWVRLTRTDNTSRPSTPPTARPGPPSARSSRSP